jgi:putative acetyltransferase
MNKEVQVRRARPEDADGIRQLFQDTIRTVNSRDYHEAQIRAWISASGHRERWLQKIESQYFLVAEMEEGLGGFASITHDGYIDFLFVHKDRQGQGIAGALWHALKNFAEQRGLKKLTASVSITAGPFFEKAGFTLESVQSVEVRGETLINYRMQREI